jgi:hypothetical protein
MLVLWEVLRLVVMAQVVEQEQVEMVRGLMAVLVFLA